MTFFKQFYLGCLAHASYLIGSEGEAAVVDPQRDVDFYIEEAAREGLKIRHVIETHLHADFVSGHIELARRSGAKIYFGKTADALFDHTLVSEGDEIALGKIRLRFMETPGHTPEGISILVFDPASASEPQKILTGDTLFIGDVGRPDLVGSKGFSPEAMAGMLYDSLHDKILKLPDSVEIFPAHGAGSACGKNISDQKSATLGDQKKTNYALAPMTKEAFVKMMTTDLPNAPAYFFHDAQLNREGAPALSDLSTLNALTPSQVLTEMNRGATVIDLRDAPTFGASHVPGSINIGLSGSLAPWAGALISPSEKIILVAENSDQASEGRMRLARVGLENVLGYLSGTMAEWAATGLDTAAVAQWTPSELLAKSENGKEKVTILDVRKPSEFSEAHISGAIHLPLDSLLSKEAESTLGKLDRSHPIAVICGSGYRSSIATGLLKSRHQVQNIANIAGGMSAWTAQNFPTKTPVK